MRLAITILVAIAQGAASNHLQTADLQANCASEETVGKLLENAQEVNQLMGVITSQQATIAAQQATISQLQRGPPPSQPPAQPPVQPPAFNESVYCGDRTCGISLLNNGWTVLTEFGSLLPNRFGGSSVNTADGVYADGWTNTGRNDWDGGTADMNGVNACDCNAMIVTFPDAMQWFAGGGYPKAAITRTLPPGTSEVLAAWGGFNGFGCKLVITDDSGSRTWTHKSATSCCGTSSSCSCCDTIGTCVEDTTQVTLVAISSSNAGSITFEEDGICWTMYVLVR